MTNRICELPDCDKPRHQKQRYCASHYMKKYRYGDPYYIYKPPFVDRTGQRYGQLIVLSRTANGRWLCRCDCGGHTVVRPGCFTRGVETCDDRAAHRRLDFVKYAGAHDRVRSERGRVQQYSCMDCGRPAQHWSYDHTDPDELLEVVTGYLVAYSMKPSHYQPRCIRCHRRFDRAHKQSVPV